MFYLFAYLLLNFEGSAEISFLCRAFLDPLIYALSGDL